MKKILFLSALVFAVFLLNSCQTSDLELPLELPTDSGQVTTPARTTPINVMDNYISTQAITPQAVNIDSGNLFDNGGFESGLAGWTGCEANAITESNEAYEGSKALKLNTGNCFYRSAQVNAGQDLILSCYVRLQSGSAWTGMGMGFADSNWATIAQVPTTIITGSSYARYDVKATVPANGKYASMWLYSDNPTLVDNCSLMLESTPPPPPPVSGEDLLENSGFGFRVGGDPILDWNKGCAGSVRIINHSIVRLRRSVALYQGACLDQSLSASDIAELSGKDFTYSCLVKNIGGYAAISIFLDGQAISATIPESQYYQTVTIQGNAGNPSNGFVSIYSEGGIDVDECGLRVGNIGILPRPGAIQKYRIAPGEDPLDLSEPTAVLFGIKNAGNVEFTTISLRNDILNCNATGTNIQVNEYFNLECTLPAMEPGQSFESTLSLVVETANGPAVTKEYQQEHSFNLVSLINNNEFEILSQDNNLPTDWVKGCGGSWSIADSIYGQGIDLNGDACIDQEFDITPEVRQWVAGRSYKLSCFAKNSGGGYASISLSVGGQLIESKVIPANIGGNGFESVEIKGFMPDSITSTSRSFVSVYSETDLFVDRCSLTVENVLRPN